MRTFPGRVVELQSDHQGRPTVWVACPSAAIPAPGQYLKASAPEAADEVLPTLLFAAETTSQGFRAVPPVPVEWLPGTALSLWGPLGNGFRLEWNIRRLALVAIGDISRLACLIPLALERGMDITLFADVPVPRLPDSIEVSPLSALPEALTWADFFALDIPLEKLSSLRSILGLKPDQLLPSPAQALVATAMPCAGLADCGACAVLTRRGWKLACQDGPVFAVRDLIG
jgi:hypothetical protein